MFARIARGADRKRAVFETGRRKIEREATLLISKMWRPNQLTVINARQH
jgi:hypothetical protein